MGEVGTIGLDLAKNVFQAHGADASGGVVFRKQMRRGQVLEFFGRQGAHLLRDPTELHSDASRRGTTQRLTPQSRLVMDDDVVELAKVPFRLDLLPEAAGGGAGIAVEHW